MSLARFDVGSLTTLPVTTASTVAHDLRVTPKAVVLLGGSTAAANTTAEKAQLSIIAGDPQNRLVNMGFQAPWFFNTSALVGDAAGELRPNLVVQTTAAAPGVQSLSLTSHISSESFSLEVGATTNAPVGFFLIGGDEIAVKASTFTLATAVGAQTCTGFGFKPNFAFVLARSDLTSVDSYSVGVIAEDSAGSKQQWHVTQAARSASAPNGKRKASSESAVQLLTYTAASTAANLAHSMEFTSFLADGALFNVSVTDTARPAKFSILALQVPKIDVGSATVSNSTLTVNVGTQQLGSVFFASAGDTGTTALQKDAKFSIGFSDSAGGQKSVAGTIRDESAQNSSAYGNYFDDTHAISFVDAATAAGIGVTVEARGTFAVDAASSGGKLTFDTTQANGRRIFYAAFSNVVQDVEAHIQVDGSMNARLQEVTRMSAAVDASVSMNANAEPQFIPTEGKVHAQAKIETRTERDDDRTYNVISNSSSPDITDYMNVTTTPQSLRVANYQNAKHLTIIPPSTNTVPLRLSGSLNSPGFPISSRGQNSIAISERSGNDLYLHTTSTGTTIEGVRVILR